MTTVRSVVHPGWLEVTGPGVHAVVAAADRHAEALGAAAARGLLPLLEALTAHGISGAPDFVVAAPGDSGVRVLVRGSGSVVLADGTRVGSDGRMPWADVDVDAAAAGDEVSVEAPAPEVPRGWRRPARLARGAATAAPSAVASVLGGPAVDSPSPSRGADTVHDDIDQSGDPDRVDAPAERGDIDESADPDPDAAATDPVVAEAPQPDLTLPPPDDAPGLPPVARVPASPPPRGGLIDAVPWRRPGGPARPHRRCRPPPPCRSSRPRTTSRPRHPPSRSPCRSTPCPT